MCRALKRRWRDATSWANPFPRAEAPRLPSDHRYAMPIVLVVGLVIVIERSRRIEREDDDECEDESRTGLLQQPPRRGSGRVERIPREATLAL